MHVSLVRSIFQRLLVGERVDHRGEGFYSLRYVGHARHAIGCRALISVSLAGPLFLCSRYPADAQRGSGYRSVSTDDKIDPSLTRAVGMCPSVCVCFHVVVRVCACVHVVVRVRACVCSTVVVRLLIFRKSASMRLPRSLRAEAAGIDAKCLPRQVLMFINPGEVKVRAQSFLSAESHHLKRTHEGHGPSLWCESVAPLGTRRRLYFHTVLALIWPSSPASSALT